MEKELQEVYERIKQEIEGVDCGEYAMYNNEVLAIAQHYDNDFISGSYDMFRCGFIKGIRFMQDHGWRV